MFEIYKPKQRLKAGDVYHSKPEIAALLIRQIQQMGFVREIIFGKKGDR